jgi:RNA polymerase sigma-70 factor (ECF subfamily)
MDDSHWTEIVEAGRDLEFDYIQARFRDDFKRAFTLAVASLTKRQRSLLGFHYAERLTIEQVAGVYRVSRATAARWLSDARAQLLAETRRLIAERLATSDSEIDSMMKLLGSRVDLSLSMFLRPTPSE